MEKRRELPLPLRALTLAVVAAPLLLRRWAVSRELGLENGISVFGARITYYHALQGMTLLGAALVLVEIWVPTRSKPGLAVVLAVLALLVLLAFR